MNGPILVTGANGTLGTALVDQLATAGQRVRALVRPGRDASALEVVSRTHGPDLVDVVRGTLTDAAALAPLLDGVTTVHHLAAGMRGHPAELWASSVVATRVLLDAVAEHRPGVRLVLTSSLAVYATATASPGSEVDEHTPLEPRPELRDPYTMAKLGQERLCWQAHDEGRVRLTVVRPGPIHGPAGAGIPARVGLQAPGAFLFLGADNPLPLIDLDDATAALVLAGGSDEMVGRALNVVADDQPTCRQYLHRYRREVQPLRTVPVPLVLARYGAGALQRYERHSRGQLPAVLTPYRVAASWTSLRFSNQLLRSLGWRQAHSTDEALGRALARMRARVRELPG